MKKTQFSDIAELVRSPDNEGIRVKSVAALMGDSGLNIGARTLPKLDKALNVGNNHIRKTRTLRNLIILLNIKLDMILKRLEYYAIRKIAAQILIIFIFLKS